MGDVKRKKAAGSLGRKISVPLILKKERAKNSTKAIFTKSDVIGKINMRDGKI